MHLKDLKQKSPVELVAMAEEMGVEGASTLRKQDLMFSILKVRAEGGAEIMGMGTVEVLNDGFGFLRSPEANYLAGPDDIYVTPNLVRRFGLRTGDTVEGEIRGPKDGERYFALQRVTQINFDDPEAVRHRVNFDNLTPLYPNSKLRLDTLDPTVKDKSARVIESSRMTTSFLCSTRRLAFSMTISATWTWRCAGSSKVEEMTSPLTERCMSVTSSGRSSIKRTIRNTSG